MLRRELDGLKGRQQKGTAYYNGVLILQPPLSRLVASLHVVLFAASGFGAEAIGEELSKKRP
jgi:hypothetical protein